MMEENREYILFMLGVIIVMVFIAVVVINMIPRDKEDNSYYAKVKNTINAKIESIEIIDNKLTIKTSGDAYMYCVKTTRSTPNDDSICWKNIVNNEAETSVYSYKKYYVWIKDSSGHISNYQTINAN